MVTKEELLRALPPYEDEWEMVNPDQHVRDIIEELRSSYPLFVDYYDRIGGYFIGYNIDDTCEQLYQFCKKYIRYKEETEAAQTSALPTGILTRGYGDCKAYAQFIGGCLAAIGRLTGERINWEYAFVSYKLFEKTPYHVFVVVHSPTGDIWVDPTPGAEGEEPKHMVLVQVDKGARASVNGNGQLEYGKVAGLIPTTGEVPPGSLPLPQGYPAGLPMPFITGGKIRFTGVPPNFDPSDEQLAWMLLALQPWVTVYGSGYNVFAWRSHTDGTGASIATWIAQFCRLYNPAWRPTTNFFGNMYGGNSADTRYLDRSMEIAHKEINNFDFGNPPAPFEPSEIEKFFDGLAIAVLKVASNLLPVIGPAYAQQWINHFFNDGSQAAVNADVAKKAADIVKKQQPASQTESGNTWIVLLTAAAILAWWWFDE